MIYHLVRNNMRSNNSQLKAQFASSLKGSQVKIPLISHTPETVYQINISPHYDDEEYEEYLDFETYRDKIQRAVVHMRDLIRGTHKGFDIKLYLDISLNNTFNPHFHGLIQIHDMLYFIYWLQRLRCHYYVDTIDDMEKRTLYMEKFTNLIKEEHGIYNGGIITNKPDEIYRKVEKVDKPIEDKKEVTIDLSEICAIQTVKPSKNRRRVKLHN